MRIIDRYYLITLLIILIGMPTLLYIKINVTKTYTYNIVIYGDTIDATMLAYYIDQQVEKQIDTDQQVINFNITLVSTPQAAVEEEKRQFRKTMFSFCGVEREWMALLDRTNLKYNIKEYGIYFGEILENLDKNQFRIYSTEQSLLTSLAQYGLSNYAAHNFFLKFANSINHTDKAQIKHKQYKLEELSTSNIIKNYFPYRIEQNSLQYFSQTLGLDQNYIQNFIIPVIWGNYLHQANSLSTLFKLLPVYCHKRPQIGKSLILFEQQNKIKQKMLGRITKIKINFINNKLLQTYSIVKDTQNQKKKYVTTWLNQKGLYFQGDSQTIKNDTTFLKSDVLFIFQNIESQTTVKQFSYYKTIIDGKIKNDQLYEQFFTIYLKVKPKRKEEEGKEEIKREKGDAKTSSKAGQFNPIYSISRICAYNCKGYQNSVYILISKHKLSSSKHLDMFESHNIIYFKKFFNQMSQMPANKKLQQNENVYKIYDIDSISDSFQVQLNLVKQISISLIQKIKRQYLG